MLSFSCEKGPSAQTGNSTEAVAPSEPDKEWVLRLQRLSAELAKAESEIEQLREENKALTARIVANEAKSSSMAKIIEMTQRSYKSGSARETCILNIRNLQQAVRAHQNLQGFRIGDDLHRGDIIGKGKFFEAMPQCPLGGEYILNNKFPTVGNLAAHCPHEGKHNHRPESTEGW